jgi:hypothetical protein
VPCFSDGGRCGDRRFFMALGDGSYTSGNIRESTFRWWQRTFSRRANPVEEGDCRRIDMDGFASDSVARRLRCRGARVRVGSCFDPRTGRLRGADGPSEGCLRNFFLGYLSRLSFIQIGLFGSIAGIVLDGVLI